MLKWYHIGGASDKQESGIFFGVRWAQPKRDHSSIP
jgi:hypothetical protein